MAGCLLAAALAVPTAACADDSTTVPTTAPATVTVTAANPAPEAGATASGAGPSTEPSAGPAALPRQERGFDVGYVEDVVETPAGTVLSIDRLTVVGVEDDRLAAEGVPMQVDDGTRFTNQAVRRHEAGVSPDARFYLTTCEADGSGTTIRSEPVDLDTFVSSPGFGDTAVTIAYRDGLVVRAETNPRC